MQKWQRMFLLWMIYLQVLPMTYASLYFYYLQVHFKAYALFPFLAFCIWTHGIVKSTKKAHAVLLLRVTVWTQSVEKVVLQIQTFLLQPGLKRPQFSGVWTWSLRLQCYVMLIYLRISSVEQTETYTSVWANMLRNCSRVRFQQQGKSFGANWFYWFGVMYLLR